MIAFIAGLCTGLLLTLFFAAWNADRAYELGFAAGRIRGVREGKVTLVRGALDDWRHA